MIGRTRRAMTLVEIVVVTLILIIAGLALSAFVRTTYGPQDTITGQTSADMTARQSLDILADKLRNAQWCTVAGTPSAVVTGNSSSITVYTSTTDNSQTLKYALTGGNLVKYVNGSGTGTTVLTGISSLTITYYRANDYTTAITPAAADYPLIGAVGITATASKAQMNTYTRQYSTYVRLRNSPPPG